MKQHVEDALKKSKRKGRGEGCVGTAASCWVWRTVSVTHALMVLGGLRGTCEWHQRSGRAQRVGADRGREEQVRLCSALQARVRVPIFFFF